MSDALHGFIERYNVLQNPENILKRFFASHRNLYKVVLVANHIFRALAMTGLCLFLPFSPLVNAGICLLGSLFYRLTVENNCSYKFALPAFAGGIAFPVGLYGIIQLVTGAAFASFATLGLSFLSILPLAAYLTYVVLTVNYDVNHRG